MENNKQTKNDLDRPADYNITPETRVGDLLNNYPQLENTLIEMAPHFKKLRNPILRKTVAKVTTLRQAAKIGNVTLTDMINRLRKEVGLASETESLKDDPVSNDKPDWMNDYSIVKTLDARKMIEEGMHPIKQVMKELNLLENGQTFELITSFIPAPLIDIAKDKGFLAYSEEKEQALVKTYFTKKD